MRGGFDGKLSNIKSMVIYSPHHYPALPTNMHSAVCHVVIDHAVMGYVADKRKHISLCSTLHAPVICMDSPPACPASSATEYARVMSSQLTHTARTGVSAVGQVC